MKLGTRCNREPAENGKPTKSGNNPIPKRRNRLPQKDTAPPFLVRPYISVQADAHTAPVKPQTSPPQSPKTQNVSRGSCLRELSCPSGLPDCGSQYARRRLLRTDYRFMRTFPLVTAAISSGAAIHTSPSMECLMALAAQAKSICAAGSSSVTTRPAISVDSV